MNAVFLSGFMGCGKTTAAKAYAKATNTKHIDLDEYIEQKMGAKIPEIFENFGEETFRKMEADCIKELCNQHIIVSCGGGAMADGRNYGTAVLAKAYVVFVDTPFALCLKRIREDGDKKRPLAAGKTDLEIADLFLERHPLYEKNCDGKVDGFNLSIVIAAEIMLEVAEIIEERLDRDIAQVDREEYEKEAKKLLQLAELETARMDEDIKEIKIVRDIK
jgi:shikimate kinase